MKSVGNDFGGFCTHSSILFLTWHRPYLALFEVRSSLSKEFWKLSLTPIQAELYKHVNFIANAYADDERKAEYVKAAKTFRMPYWDWARRDLGVFPPQASSKKLNPVIRPKSIPGKSDINPLANYIFRESKSQKDINTVNTHTLSVHAMYTLTPLVSKHRRNSPLPCFQGQRQGGH